MATTRRKLTSATNVATLRRNFAAQHVEETKWKTGPIDGNRSTALRVSRAHPRPL